ncbi:MAG: hypothetical protein QW241_05965 [Candidatus Bathyarchaeia archaeon]
MLRELTFHPTIHRYRECSQKPFTTEEGRARITVIGYNDSTEVTIYDLTEGVEKARIIDKFTVNRLQYHVTGLSNEREVNVSIPTFFKVVSNKPVAVLLSTGTYSIDKNILSGQCIYYPSTDGGFAGKEFIFMAVPAYDIHARKGWDYAIYAIEDSEVEVRDSQDNIIKKYTLAANSSRRLEIVGQNVYRIVSTGRIIVGSWAFGFSICPNYMGGHIGRLFYTNPYGPRLLGSECLLIVAQERPTKVKIHDMESGSTLLEKDLQPREMWFIDKDVKDLEGVRVMITSTEDILVYAGSVLVPAGYSSGPGQISSGVSLIIVRANQPTTIFSVSDAYVIAPSNAKIQVGGAEMVIPKDSCRSIPAGKITITSNTTVIVQTISEVNYFSEQSSLFGFAGLRGYATYLIPVNSLELTYPPPQKTTTAGPSGGGYETYYPIIGIAAAAITTIAVVIILLRIRSGKNRHKNPRLDV